MSTGLTTLFRREINQRKTEARDDESGEGDRPAAIFHG